MPRLAAVFLFSIFDERQNGLIVVNIVHVCFGHFVFGV